MRKELVFNIKHNYTVGMHYFKTNKKLININEVGIKNVVLSNKVFYGKGADKYYIGYLGNNFRPLCIINREIELHTYHMNILANNKEFLKYIEI